MSNLRITVQSGLQLAAIYTEPQTKADKYPFVLLLHGNTGWKEEEHISTLADELAANGIASLRFDAPGSGESDGTWEQDYRVSNHLAAVNDVISYATKNFAVDSAKVGIWGHSMGGMVAVYAAAQNPQGFKAVCGSQLSPGNVARDHRDDIDHWRENDGASIESGHFGTIWLPADYFMDRLQFTTKEAVKDVRAPLLLIAGTEDDLVPASYVREIYNAANEPKEYVEYAMDHFYKRDANMLQRVNAVTVDFFKRQLFQVSNRHTHIIMKKTIPTHAVKAVITNEQGDILFLQRNAERRADRQFNWDLPGGLVDEGEDDRAALTREVEEELGRRAVIVQVVGRWTFFRPFDNKTVEVTNYEATLDTDNIEDLTLSDEHVGAQWVSRAALSELEVKDQSLFTALGE